jgi:hypothetical protein
VDTVPHAPHPIPKPAHGHEKGAAEKNPARSVIRGAVDLGGVTFAAPEQ